MATLRKPDFWKCCSISFACTRHECCIIFARVKFKLTLTVSPRCADVKRWPRLLYMNVYIRACYIFIFCFWECSTDSSSTRQHGSTLCGYSTQSVDPKYAQRWQTCGDGQEQSLSNTTVHCLSPALTRFNCSNEMFARTLLRDYFIHLVQVYT